MPKPGYVQLLCWVIFIAAAATLSGNANCVSFSYGPRDVNQIIKDNDLLYLGTDAGLVCINAVTDSITNYHWGNSGLTALRVHSLAKSQEGKLWIGTENGLYKLQNGIISQVQANALKRDIPVLFVDANNTLWLGLGLSGATSFYKLDADENLTEVMLMGGPQSICATPDGTLWLGYDDCLRSYVPATAETHVYNETNSSLPDYVIKSLKCNSQGNLWVLSSTGLTMIPPAGNWISYGGSVESPFAGGKQLGIDQLDRVWIVMNNY